MSHIYSEKGSVSKPMAGNQTSTMNSSATHTRVRKVAAINFTTLSISKETSLRMAKYMQIAKNPLPTEYARISLSPGFTALSSSRHNSVSSSLFLIKIDAEEKNRAPTFYVISNAVNAIRAADLRSLLKIVFI